MTQRVITICICQLLPGELFLFYILVSSKHQLLKAVNIRKFLWAILLFIDTAQVFTTTGKFWVGNELPKLGHSFFIFFLCCSHRPVVFRRSGRSLSSHLVFFFRLNIPILLTIPLDPLSRLFTFPISLLLNDSSDISVSFKINTQSRTQYVWCSLNSS